VTLGLDWILWSYRPLKNHKNRDPNNKRNDITGYLHSYNNNFFVTDEQNIRTYSGTAHTHAHTHTHTLPAVNILSSKMVRGLTTMISWKRIWSQLHLSLDPLWRRAVGTWYLQHLGSLSLPYSTEWWNEYQLMISGNGNYLQKWNKQITRKISWLTLAWKMVFPMVSPSK